MSLTIDASETEGERIGWKPTLDFVYYRKPKAVETIGDTKLVKPEEKNMRIRRVVAVGPGRPLAGGAVRVPACKAGDLIRLNGADEQPGDGHIDDDGERTYLVGAEAIIGVRGETGGWWPTHDFVYFRPEAQEKSSGLVLHVGDHGTQNAKVLAVGPGRVLSGGGVRKPSCAPGDYIIIAVIGGDQNAQPVTEFIDDDGRATYVVSCEFIAGERGECPPAVLSKRIVSASALPPTEKEIEVIRDIAAAGIVREREAKGRN